MGRIVVTILGCTLLAALVVADDGKRRTFGSRLHLSRGKGGFLGSFNSRGGFGSRSGGFESRDDTRTGALARVIDHGSSIGGSAHNFGFGAGGHNIGFSVAQPDVNFNDVFHGVGHGGQIGTGFEGIHASVGHGNIALGGKLAPGKDVVISSTGTLIRHTVIDGGFVGEDFDEKAFEGEIDLSKHKIISDHYLRPDGTELNADELSKFGIATHVNGGIQGGGGSGKHGVGGIVGPHANAVAGGGALFDGKHPVGFGGGLSAGHPAAFGFGHDVSGVQLSGGSHGGASGVKSGGGFAGVSGNKHGGGFAGPISSGKLKDEFIGGSAGKYGGALTGGKFGGISGGKFGSVSGGKFGGLSGGKFGGVSAGKFGGISGAKFSGVSGGKFASGVHGGKFSGSGSKFGGSIGVGGFGASGLRGGFKGVHKTNKHRSKFLGTLGAGKDFNHAIRQHSGYGGGFSSSFSGSKFTGHPKIASGSMKGRFKNGPEIVRGEGIKLHGSGQGHRSVYGDFGAHRAEGIVLQGGIGGADFSSFGSSKFSHFGGGKPSLYGGIIDSHELKEFEKGFDNFGDHISDLNFGSHFGSDFGKQIYDFGSDIAATGFSGGGLGDFSSGKSGGGFGGKFGKSVGFGGSSFGKSVDFDYNSFRPSKQIAFDAGVSTSFSSSSFGKDISRGKLSGPGDGHGSFGAGRSSRFVSHRPGRPYGTGVVHEHHRG